MKDYKYILIGLIIAVAAWWYFFRNRVINLVGKLPTNGQYPNRPLTDITKIIIHHSATASGSPEQYADYHISKGWPGIGYHFVIQPDGTIYQANKLTTRSNQAENCNTNGVGVCLTGNFNVTRPTEAQYKALNYLISYIENKVRRPLIIEPHSACKSTSCPGANFDFDKIKTFSYA